MELKIIKQEENPLLHRKTITYQVEDHPATPSHKETMEKVSALTGKEKDSITIKKIQQPYGSPNAIVEVNVYDKPEHMKKYEIIKEEKKDEAKE